MASSWRRYQLLATDELRKAAEESSSQAECDKHLRRAAKLIAKALESDHRK